MPLQLHASSLLKTFKKAVFKLKNPSLLKKKKVILMLCLCV